MENSQGVKTDVKSYDFFLFWTNQKVLNGTNGGSNSFKEFLTR